jgi:site-specific recombinase XerD
LAKGADIEKVQLLLGHDGIDETRPYIDVAPAVLQRAFEDAF